MKKGKILYLLPTLCLLLTGCGGGSGGESQSQGGNSSGGGHVHKYVEHAAVAKTCEEDGNIFYYSCDCGMYFDEDKNELTYSQIIIPASHELVKFDEVPGLEVTEAEHYQCSVCHKFFADDEGALELEEGDWYTSGSAIHFGKGDIMVTSKTFTEIKLADLKGKALAFDFRMVEDGTNIMCIGQTNDTYNVSGAVPITKSGETYTCPGTIIRDSEAHTGYKTLVMNETLFSGDGVRLHGADGIDRIFGDWDHSQGHTRAAESEMFIDPDSFRVVDSFDHTELGPNLVYGNDVDTPLGYTITKTELKGKALSFNAYFGATGTQEIKISLYYNGWVTRFIPDIFIRHTGDAYQVRQLSPSYEPIPSQATDLGDGWVNILVNAKSLDIQSEIGDTCVVWANPTTARNGVDINSFKAVDAFQASEEIKFAVGDFKTFGDTINFADLISNGAVSFKIKIQNSTSVKLSFMAVLDGEWINYSTSYFNTNSSGALAVYYQNGSTQKGVVEKLEDNWFKVTLNEYELDGDGRSYNGSVAATHIYCENAGFTIDGGSIEYCAPHAQTGLSYGAEQIIVTSWTEGVRNFSYVKSKMQFAHAGLAFEIKPVGDGAIKLAFNGDDWSNISGEFTITKSGDSVTTTYANGNVVARADGWYSIYIPSPWTGDGYTTSGWASFAMIYSAAGYSGTSLTVNWNSFHMYYAA